MEESCDGRAVRRSCGSPEASGQLVCMSQNAYLSYRCIQGLTKFIQPILDGVCAAIGWKVTFIAGGPEPAHGGRLNVLRYVLYG